MDQKRLIVVALFALLSQSASSLFNISFAATPEKEMLEKNKAKEESLPLEQLRNFSDIFARIKSNYVEQVGDKELLENAIRGMLSGLDPHSTYLDPDEYKELRIDTTGQFGGLGIQVGMENGYVKVISPIDDTPAFKAGIKAGDLIIRLNDKSVKDIGLHEAVKLMRGLPGTPIEIGVLREGKEDPLVFRLNRAIIKVQSVKSFILEPGFGYVRVSTFQSKTAVHLKNAIDKLVKENTRPLNGLILDLRNNPGGILNAAADVSDLFIETGKLVYTQGRTDDSYFEFVAKPGDILNKAPMVVLINGGSASASDKKSFGKGSVQTIQELRNGGAVKFTTARYFTPKGRSIQAVGISPDIVIDDFNAAEKNKQGLTALKESDLSGHISNPNNKKVKKKKKNLTENDRRIKKLHKDYKIHEALNLLKGMFILSTKKSNIVSLEKN